MFYFRGICYERSQQWPLAETDIKKALQLYPDQPLVLNYLGYSWVDKGVHLDQGMDMIRKAVEQRPDDGYIVDSLGWAYFRTGNYDEAVKNLERAVELKPEDPTINDHLGDAYWRVGRTLEAHFQWSQAKDLKPEPEDLPKIEAKLKDGLPPDTSSAADAEQAESRRGFRQGKFGGGCRKEEDRQRRLRLLFGPTARRDRAGQGQSDVAGARSPRRRLSRDFESLVVVRRLRRPLGFDAGRRACADRRRAALGASRRGRRQSRAQSRTRPCRAHPRARLGRVSSR